MCEKTNYKSSNTQIDKCIRHLPCVLSLRGFNVIASCCGHNKYHLTIVCKAEISGRCYDLISGVDIPRKRRFYKRDKQGYYYIPEVEDYYKQIERKIKK